ncbi:hypothetical protein FHR32_006320 [Streptosporangium album]|uniref:HEXXH motif-containing protein n=1 Tax=Streptosporangium album TaxID=47479 RepID=A0A7W7S117_9ACTN|nr:HEXXH motif-containing putative peptide modification protein [Streptosporangium album]MBB4941934.1 hypothetical protein [Streptosporangium album]
MSTALADPMTELGGMPFLDDSFAPGRLLALVLALRHHEAAQRGLSADSAAGPRAWLNPGRAILLNPDRPPVQETELTAAQQEDVVAVLDALPRAVPAWAPLLQLPVRYLLHPPTGAYSASIRAWPQHIFLAERAFTAPDQIRSQVLHEMCHQWMNLIQEAWPLQTREDRDLTMPSGTTGRSLAEVLGGVHVAMALIRLYRARGGERDRIEDLSRYRSGCLQIIEERSADLTDAGRSLAARLKEDA